MEPYIWGDAQVTYPDWSGTAQLDEKMTGDVDLYTLTGVDRERWHIIGLDISGGESGMHALEVVAVSRDHDPDSSGDIYPKIAEANGGEILATHIRIHDVDPFDVLKAIMHVFDFRLRVRGTRSLPIRIVGLADVPEQPDG